ncbi:MAG: STAS domain-containing protein [Magnetococcales bacterium]|nr:STAS domain-containing protein [Magnetococcales bacterium]
MDLGRESSLTDASQGASCDADGLLLKLPARATIREVASVRESLLDLMGRHARVVLDCSDVAQTDLSMVQLIIAARRSTGGDALALDVVLPSMGVMAEQIRLGGLEHEFKELWNA